MLGLGLELASALGLVLGLRLGLKLGLGLGLLSSLYERKKWPETLHRARPRPRVGARTRISVRGRVIKVRVRARVGVRPKTLHRGSQSIHAVGPANMHLQDNSVETDSWCRLIYVGQCGATSNHGKSTHLSYSLFIVFKFLLHNLLLRL